MIKLIRNQFLDAGFLVDGKLITSKPIVDVMQHTAYFDLNIAHKINEIILAVKGAQKQKVKLATKLFSHGHQKLF